MSAAKKMILVSTLTFLALVVAGAMWGHHGGDPTGTTTGGLPDYLGATGSTGNGVPVSQSGLNALATETGHLRISINFTWVLLTGFLVLFMQVGFAFLVTGLTRAKNAGHMMMMNIASFAIALARLLRGRIRVHVRRHRADRQPGRRLAAQRPDRPRQRRGARHARLLPADRRRLRRRRHGAVLVPSRLHGDRRLHHHRRDRRADLVRRVHPRRDLHGRADLPGVRHVDVGRGLARAPGPEPAPRPRRGRLRRFRCRPRHRRLGGTCARDAPRAAHREVPQGRFAERDPRPQPRLRRDRHARARVRMDGLQPGFDAGFHRPSHRTGRRQHAARGVRRVS